ncbi:YggS family pyridoxal phosphate-dependent enzyme [Kaistella sp. PBT33-4]|uniref:YggS family pyridoxal phosphate-dependent enzyme n=1 Tax=Kaistella sp. PBT33-4 TaxID=3032000 RepID=UPI0023D7E7A5|nr:YggS family pyridoxal phosphate-dependent enzyme [Kaistella sp. PBT33-4]MDF0720380.1 YggS family pyridoxal phosphate-dependent enzyme [Kaistella sp. PBT33-4]
MNSDSIGDRYNNVRTQLPPEVQLVVVTKTHPADTVRELYNLGHRHFSENKVQEMLTKQMELPADIKWHLIGHLQTNKVKHIAEFIHLIESVDSEKLLQEIDRQAQKHNRTINVLLQVRIATEETKFGLEISETRELFSQWTQGLYPNVKICGLMGMATYTDDQEQVKWEFSTLKRLFDQLAVQKEIQILSMGMSGDYKLAIECGSNSVRVGSAICGARDYQ